jgi:hypothetical protein
MSCQFKPPSSCCTWPAPSFIAKCEEKGFARPRQDYLTTW